MLKTILVSLLIFTGLAASAQPGSLDSSFGNNGLSVNDFGNDETIFASTVQPDGKIIFVGSDVVKGAHGQGNTCAISRYQPNGFPDSSFGQNGLIYILVDKNGKSNFFSVALQKDGKILIAGFVYTEYSYYYHSVIFRCTKEGAIDSTFGDKGFVQPQGNEFPNTILGGLTVQPDGKILAIGSINELATGETGTSMLIVRLMQNGKRDMSFGKKGKQVISVNEYSTASALKLLPDGKFLIGGTAYSADKYAQNFAAVRLTSAGILDSSFGNAGSLITRIYDYSYVTDMVLTNTGQFVLGGAAVAGEDADFALVRYNANGTVDSSFGNNGITTTDFGMYDDITQLALQPDGKVVAFGIMETTANNYRAKFALARYNKNGKLDASFGSNGIVTTDFGNKISQAWTGFIQSNGRIVAAGITSSADNNNDFALAGYKSEQQSLQLFYPITKVVLKK